ncbi:MAG TPA: tRNA 4-thiouridine(8) synthase ThiI [Candidatus Anaerofilum excrementigallinarum]|nr:tRNA 4-thiouridine(8) synthase ThiI [Candidatus Anaerofilum excrementigallinarum]
MKEIILAFQGEMALKGLNRATFESTLMKTLRRRLEHLGEFKVYKAQSTMYVEPLDEFADMDGAYDKVCKTFGLASVCRAAVSEKSFEAICNAAEEYLGSALRASRTFKVEARRADKTFPMKSPEIARELGAFLLSKHPHLRVDVKNPQIIVYVEVRDFGAYIHGPKEPGAGGLPVSTSGRAITMLSGGIDSPVAAWMMAKRGLSLHHIHFASPPYTSERAKLKVQSLGQLLCDYTGNTNLYVVPYTEPQVYIRDNAPDVLFTVLMRRSMLRITKMVADRIGCDGIVTGESLAQVASQTLKALACTDQAQSLPILRPLLGMDKTEIVDIARRIGTFETSIMPYEDCCTIFTPPHPKTRPTLEEILAAEEKMTGLAELEAKAAEEAEKIHLRVGDIPPLAAI